MIRNPLLRYVAAVLLGGAAGVSLCISILPMVLQLRGAGDMSALAYYLSGLLVPSALVWAVGAVSVARIPQLQAAGITMAVVGAVSGAGLVALGLAPVLRFVVTGGMTGLIYGYLGGLIFCRLLARPAPREDAR